MSWPPALPLSWDPTCLRAPGHLPPAPCPRPPAPALGPGHLSPAPGHLSLPQATCPCWPLAADISQMMRYSNCIALVVSMVAITTNCVDTTVLNVSVCVCVCVCGVCVCVCVCVCGWVGVSQRARSVFLRWTLAFVLCAQSKQTHITAALWAFVCYVASVSSPSSPPLPLPLPLPDGAVSAGAV